MTHNFGSALYSSRFCNMTQTTFLTFRSLLIEIIGRQKQKKLKKLSQSKRHFSLNLNPVTTPYSKNIPTHLTIKRSV